MPIKHIQKISLVDYPGRISTVVFFGGCNLKCPFCHNPELVLSKYLKETPNISKEKVLSIILERKGFIDGVVFTGGEPFISFSELKWLTERLKAEKISVKVDTNGTFPEKLKYMIDENLIDYVAMDVKTSPSKYRLLAADNGISEKVKQSIHILVSSNVDYEFRTTLAPGFITEEDMREIIFLLRDAKKYILQQFIPQNTLDPEYLCFPPTEEKEIEKFFNISKTVLKNVEIRRYL